MRLLVDTPALVWWLTDNPRLSGRARSAMTDPLNELIASACAGYEIGYKQLLGGVPPYRDSLPERLRRERIAVLAISLDHALAAAALPGPHRDPWDRMMIAQANLEALTVVTVDRVFDDYGVPVLW